MRYPRKLKRPPLGDKRSGREPGFKKWKTKWKGQKVRKWQPRVPEPLDLSSRLLEPLGAASEPHTWPQALAVHLLLAQRQAQL